MFGNRRGRIERRLSAISSELNQLRSEQAILEEQVQHMLQVEADTTTDSLVAGTPASAREASAATTDRERTERARDRVLDRITALTAEQDRLLEQLL